MAPDLSVPDGAVLAEAEDEIRITEHLIVMQEVHDKLNGLPALPVLADPHPGPAAFPGKWPLPRKAVRVK